MTLLEIVISTHHCRSTHHHIAFDALQILDGPDAEDWKRLLLRHHRQLFKGAMAPDKKFRDYQNHVLHVQEGEWGGARDAAMLWYGKAVAALRAGAWSKAAYALGVLTHYYADPIQPFHTAQSEEASALHRAFDWSVIQARPLLKAMMDARGYPRLEAESHPGFVADMVLSGARYANQHYWTLIDHYDINRAAEDPESGLDPVLLEIMADLLAYATSGVALLFQRAFTEAGVAPKQVDLDVPGYLAALDIPLRMLGRRLEDRRDRSNVQKTYAELNRTGKVLRSLSAYDRAIRSLHADQVLRRPLSELDRQPLEPLGSQHVAAPRRAKPVRYELRIVPVHSAAPRFTETEQNASGVAGPDTDAVCPVSETEQIQQVTQNMSLDESSDETESPLIQLQYEVIERSSGAGAPSEQAETVKDEAGPDQTCAEQAASDQKLSADDETEAPSPRQSERGALTLQSPVVEAPSIGPKTAARLAQQNILTISDLLEADADAVAAALNVRYVKSRMITDWQDQTRLMLGAPGLRVLDSQILVGAGIRSPDDLARASATKVFKAASQFLDTPQGARILWGGEKRVDKAYVAHWIDLAKGGSENAAA